MVDLNIENATLQFGVSVLSFIVEPLRGQQVKKKKKNL